MDTPPVVPARRESTPGTAYAVFAWIFLCLSIVFLGFGLARVYRYDDVSDKIVGGDAYNYLIVELHGLGLIGVGTGLAVIAVVFAVLAVWSKSLD